MKKKRKRDVVIFSFVQAKSQFGTVAQRPGAVCWCVLLGVGVKNNTNACPDRLTHRFRKTKTKFNG